MQQPSYKAQFRHQFQCLVCKSTYNDQLSLHKHLLETHVTSHSLQTFVVNNKEHSGVNKSVLLGARGEETENGFSEGPITIDLSVSSSPAPSADDHHYHHHRRIGQYSFDNHQNIDFNTLQQQLIAVQQQQARVQTPVGALPIVNPQMYNFNSPNAQSSNNCLSSLSTHQLTQQLLLARALSASPYSSYLTNVVHPQQLYLSLNNLMSSTDVNTGAGAVLSQQQQQLINRHQVNSNGVSVNNNNNNNNDCSIAGGSASPSLHSITNSRGTPNSSMTSPSGGVRPTSAVLNPEVLEQHISRLISDNEKKLEPPPMLSKRRSYTRHHHGSLDYTTMASSSSSSSSSTTGQQRSLTNGRGCRSQSLVETSSPPYLLPQHFVTSFQTSNVNSIPVDSKPVVSIYSDTLAGATALTPASSSSSVNQALNFHAQVESATLQAMGKLYNCKFCYLGVRHLDELKRHEEKCARRDECSSKFASNDAQCCSSRPSTTNAPPLLAIAEEKRSTPALPVMDNKHPLKKRILAAEFAQKPIRDETKSPVVVSSQVNELKSMETTLATCTNQQTAAQQDQLIRVTKSSCALTSTAAQSLVDNGPKFIASDAYLQVIPKVSLSTSEHLGILRPYCVTVKIQGATALEPTKSGRKPHHVVTQTTNSASLRRIVPSLDWKISEYTRWPQIVASPLESKLNIMLMDGFMTKCHRPYLHYTVADKDLNLMRVTHSTYWTYSKKRFPYLSTSSSISVAVDFPTKLSPASSSTSSILSPEGISNYEHITDVVAIDINEESDDKASIMRTIRTMQTACCQPIVSVKGNIEEFMPTNVIAACSIATTTVEDVSNSSSSSNTCQDYITTTTTTTTTTSSVNATKAVDNTATATVFVSCTSSLSKELLKSILSSNSHHSVKKVAVCNGGYRTNEAYTYVRGRGRGRYVCARCGIRCKKPSMLKKHIRTHLNVRPYSCALCVFSFKTKGNLTKHLKSKSHSRKCASLQINDDDRDAKVDLSCSSIDILGEDTDETLSEDELENMSDDEMETIDQQIWQHGSNPTNELRQRICSFRNVWNRVRTGMYFNRQVKTPPLDAFIAISDDLDRCDSAPPSITLDSASVDLSPSEQVSSSSSSLVTTSAMYSSVCETKNASSVNAMVNNNNNNNYEPSTSSQQQHELTVSTAVGGECDQNFIASTKNNYLNCLAAESKTKCEICGDEFLKFGSLRLHMYTHVVEQSNKRQSDKCPYCNSYFRSKNVLQKHLLHAHPQQSQNLVADAASSSLGGMSSQSQLSQEAVNVIHTGNNTGRSQTMLPLNISPSSSANKPRPFECRDCGKSFRIHGHLAKHLRSKSHIMQLECLEKVPIGTFAKLEESNCDYFTDIDTSDSENSLKSLLKLAQKLMMMTTTTTTTAAAAATNSMKEHRTFDNTEDRHVDRQLKMGDNRTLIASRQSPTAPSTNTVISSFTCTEELRPSPSPTTPSPKKHSDKVTTAGRTVVADVWIPPKETCDRAPVVVVSGGGGGGGISSESPRQTAGHVINATFAKPVPHHVKHDSQQPSSVCVKQPVDSNNANLASSSSSSNDCKSKTDTFCQFCSIDFQSLIELEIHWHADHIFMRDGRNFKCPKANCDTVYPSKRDLRNHLSSHYYGTLDSDTVQTPGCSGDVSKSTVVALSKKIVNNSVSGNNNGTFSNNGADSSPSDAYSRKLFIDKTKTQVIRLKFGSNETVPSADSSPISDSDASRASIGSQSLSPSQNCSGERYLLKRHSSEDCVSLVPSKRLIMDDMAQRNATNCKEVLDATSRNVTPSAVTLSQQQQHSQQTNNFAAAPSPLAVPVPVVAQRPTLWNSFVNNCGPSSPQSMYLPAAATLPMQNSAAAFLGLSHPALLAAVVQQNTKLFNGACWPSPFALNSLNHGGVQLLNQSLPGQHAFGAGTGSSSNSSHHHEPSSLLEQLRCMLCQKQCYSLVSLQEHLMSHVQPRSHVCKFCDAAFTTAQALQAHMPCRMQKVSTL